MTTDSRQGMGKRRGEYISADGCETAACTSAHYQKLEMWANAQPDGRPAEYK